MTTTVYILDIASYDARGGAGRPFATLEGAKAAAGPSVRWLGPSEVGGVMEWEQDMGDRRGSTEDVWVIVAHPLGP